jgi:hypothetical protein
MSPQIDITTVVPEPATQADGALFSDLFTGSAAEARSAFDRYIPELDILPYLTVMPTTIHSWARHHPMLLTKVTCDNWKTQRARKTAEGFFIVTDPARFHDVHMEVGVQLGKAILELMVHHETSPYVVEAKLSSVVDANTAEKYRRRRKDFIGVFGQQCLPADFRFTNRWMLIGSAEYDFTGKTVSEVSAWLASMIDAVADGINWTMFMLDERARQVAECEAVVSEPSETPALMEEPGERTAVGDIADDTYVDEEVPFPTED